MPERPAVRDRGVRVEKLERRDGDEALADRFLVGIADRPRFVEGRELPLRVRHDPAILVREVDAGRRAETKHPGVLRDRVRADSAYVRRERSPAGQRVEVDIARVREPVNKIERTVRTPVVERRAADAERARRDIHDGIPRRGALRERRESGDHLEG